MTVPGFFFFFLVFSFLLLFLDVIFWFLPQPLSVCARVCECVGNFNTQNVGCISTFSLTLALGKGQAKRSKKPKGKLKIN